LAIHFSEIDSFNCYSIVDERSAAFVGMGMAMSEKNRLQLPVQAVLLSKLLSGDYGSFLSEYSAFDVNC
jgi:hypothetical protein